MIVELHIIQNFSPSNLNRDDANTPKDCDFGGYRRARISSQCIKRSVRCHPLFAECIKKAGGDIGIRTKRLKRRIKDLFMEKYGKSEDEADKVSGLVIEYLGFKLSDQEKTEYLLYFGENEVLDIARIGADHWDVLCTAEPTAEKDEVKKKKKTVSDELKKVQTELNSVISRNRKEARSYAADIALFGRMVADNKNMNVDAACQVAHGISTHKVEMEMDYFTAVDDLLPDEESGSDMIGIVEFNSSCFYRYSLVHIDKLVENLGFNRDLLRTAVLIFIESSIKAIPTGKQNSMAAQNPAGYARVIVRKDGFPWSLANAFQMPVAAGLNESIEERSIEALNHYFDKLVKVYGDSTILCDRWFNVNDPASISLDLMINDVGNVLANEVSS